MSQYVNLVFVIVLQILDAFITPFVFRVQRPEYDDCHPGYHVACLRHEFQIARPAGYHFLHPFGDALI